MEVLPYKIYSNKDLLEAKGVHIEPKASLLVAFYNNTRFFDIVFASVENQTYKNFELVICDDGSRPDVVDHIHKAMKNTSVLVKHLWQEDKGFRKAEMLNKALVNSDSDYMIFIDQDCVLHPEFIREHVEHKKARTALSGRRVELSPFVSDLITAEKVRKGYIEKNIWWMIPLIAHRRDSHSLKGIYIRNEKIRKLFNNKHKPIVGCNYSVHKSDLEKVNGFDMRYTIAGIAEDCDIEYRLLLEGIDIQPVCYGAVQYHLFHKLRPRDDTFVPLLNEVKAKQAKVTPFGMSLVQPQKAIQL